MSPQQKQLALFVLCGCDYIELHISTTNAAIAAGAKIVAKHHQWDTCVGVIQPNDTNGYAVDILDSCQSLNDISSTLSMQHSVSKLKCFSFHPLKKLHCYGDGGAICTNDYELYNILIKTRNHGRIGKSNRYLWGANSRLDEIQAAVLRVYLRKLKGGKL